MFWGEPTDTGDYQFRGRTLKWVNSSGTEYPVIHSGNIGSYAVTSETDTLQTVTSRGNSTSASLTMSSTTPFEFTGTSNTGTYNRTSIYVNQNNTSADTANGIFIERGRLTDSGSAEVRHFCSP